MILTPSNHTSYVLCLIDIFLYCSSVGRKRLFLAALSILLIFALLFYSAIYPTGFRITLSGEE